MKSDWFPTRRNGVIFEIQNLQFEWQLPRKSLKYTCFSWLKATLISGDRNESSRSPYFLSQ